MTCPQLTCNMIWECEATVWAVIMCAGFLDRLAFLCSAPVLQSAIVLMRESVSLSFSSENVVILTGGGKKNNHPGRIGFQMGMETSSCRCF